MSPGALLVQQRFQVEMASRLKTVQAIAETEAERSRQLVDILTNEPAIPVGEVLRRAEPGSAAAEALRPELAAQAQRVGGNAPSLRDAAIDRLRQKEQKYQAYADFFGANAIAVIDAEPSEVATVLNTPTPTQLPAAPEIGVEESGQPMIFVVGPALTTDYPAVAALVYEDEGDREFRQTVTRCTGTLIAADAVLTAAHCLTQPGYKLKSVFFQHAGEYLLAGGDRSGWTHTAFRPPSRAFDLAVLPLALPVTGITPARLAQSPHATGAAATIVGFGDHYLVDADGRFSSRIPAGETGLKAHANIEVQDCSASRAKPKNMLCWQYRTGRPDALWGSICGGDSGGPVFANRAGNDELIGVIYGGDKKTDGSADCQVGDDAYAQDVAAAANRAWIGAWLHDHASRPAAELDPRLSPTINRVAWAYSSETPLQHKSADGTTLIRFDLKGSGDVLRLGVTASSRAVAGGRLYAPAMRLEAGPAGAAPTCRGRGESTHTFAAFCEVSAPARGAWEMRVWGENGQWFQAVGTLSQRRPTS